MVVASSVHETPEKGCDSHRTRMMEKLGVHETASLVRYAIRQGIVRA